MANFELYLIGVLFLVMIGLVIHTVRYYKAKKRMFKHMKRYAKQGDSEAELYVAEEYHKGEIVKKSCEQAHFWYHKAALHGNEKARKNLENLNKRDKKRC
jgi:TPR repeat protein